MSNAFIFQALIVGVVATLVFDVFGWLLEALFRIPAPQWGRLGRWLLNLPGGMRGVPSPNLQQSPDRRERLVGLLVHYVTGVSFAALLLFWVGPRWVERPSLLFAVVAGLVTVPLVWFVVMPALGHGMAGARLPAPAKARALTVLSHAVLGLGFYIGAYCAQVLLR